jgi:hypothetical protein
VIEINAHFSVFFQTISCVGEVKLAEAATFDAWGLEILVKFRDTEKLQLLTSQRQSGGVSRN